MTETPRVDEALQRLKDVFWELPQARLTLPEVSELAKVDTELCAMLLAALEDVRFLRQQRDGFFTKV